MSTEGDYEVGRPRYQPSAPPGTGGQGPGRDAPGTFPGPRAASAGAPPAEAVRKTAPAAVAALAFAAVGWLLPVFGGLIAIRRSKAALREIEAASGELDGVPLAVWARRLGWFYVVAWSAGLLYLALHIYIAVTDVMVKVK